MRRPVPRRLLPAAAAAALLAGAPLPSACGGEPETPEAQVRRLLGELEGAAEEGDVSAIKEHVSETYEDRRGHDRRELAAFLTFQVLRHGQRHLLVRVRDVASRQDGRVTVLLHAGLAGAGGRELVSARVYEVEMDWVHEDGTWRVTWADWKAAPPAALL